MKRILIVDDERTARKGLFFILKNQNDDIFDAESKDQAEKLLKLYDFDLAIVDLRLPTEEQGLGLIRFIRENYNLTPVLAITAYGSVDSAIKAMKAGAGDYITKDFSKAEIFLKINKLYETRDLWFDNIRLAEQVKNLKAEYNKNYQITQMIGESQEVKRILDMISRIGK